MCVSSNPCEKENIHSYRHTLYDVGTFGWMAPEVHHDNDGSSVYNRPADVFSLGLVFLALVLHKLGKSLLPFTGIYRTWFTLCQPTYDGFNLESISEKFSSS